MNREQKAEVVTDLQGKFGKAQIAFVADYQGLTVLEIQELRRSLRNYDAEVRVAKNTFLRRAVQGTGFEGLTEHFTGTTAVTVSYGDPVQPAKIIDEFAKAHPKFTIRAAVMAGKVLSPEDITALAKLPSREILLGQLLGVLNAVPTGLVRVLSGVPRTFLYGLQAIKDQKEGATN